jgi:hypothetical protein
MATQASPGLNTPSPYQALPGIPPNFSTQAAMSAGLLPANVVVSGPAIGTGVGANGGLGSIIPTLLSTLSGQDNNGSQNPTGANPGSSNIGGPSNGGAGNPANGGNPGAAPQLQSSCPESALTFPAGNSQFGG